MDKNKFIEQLASGYAFTSKSIFLGKAILNNECITESNISIPLKTLNRHGLIAGATGTGKTKTLQKLAESLSENGIGVLMMDVKGDISGIALPGIENEKIKARQDKLGIAYEAKGFPVEFLTLSKEKGAKLRATVLEFGPVLFSKILDLNETQASIVTMLFKYCDDNQLPILDLKDFRAVMQYATAEGKEAIEKEYGKISGTTISVIQRKIIELEQQGASVFFGEKSFDVTDLVRTDSNGYGYINIVRLTDIQDKPKLFCTFMLSLLSEIYNTFPEAGDIEKPKLVLFIDEAHLIFNEASKELNDQIETIIKLIRSKGIGIFFCTQNPTDIPNAVLSQLGLKIQHALRAFTAKDRKDIKLVAENYPITDFYDIDEVITQLGIGEAFVTALNEKGIPTPLAATLMSTPKSRMDILTPNEIDAIVSNSKMAQKYNEELDSKSAYEILAKKIANEDEKDEEDNADKKTNTPEKEEAEGPSFLDSLMQNSLVKSVASQAARTLTRSLLGSLGLSAPTRKRRTNKSWF
jgi:DNA helicase HerA-like ATPase